MYVVFACNAGTYVCVKRAQTAQMRVNAHAHFVRFIGERFPDFINKIGDHVLLKGLFGSKKGGVRSL